MGLSITRQPGESFMIGDAVHATIDMIRQHEVTFEVATPCGLFRLTCGAGRHATIAGAHVYVVAATAAKCRLNIEAPADVRIYRKEVWDQLSASRMLRPEHQTAILQGVKP